MILFAAMAKGSVTVFKVTLDVFDVDSVVVVEDQALLFQLFLSVIFLINFEETDLFRTVLAHPFSIICCISSVFCSTNFREGLESV